jgi:hypothetical protein
MMIYSTDAIPAAVANPEIRIIEVADGCSADRFDAHQTKLLNDWVSQGNVLWVNNNVLKLFAIRYSRLDRETHPLACRVSEAAELAPLVGDCKRVTLTGAGSKARILAGKGVMPLLMLEGDDSAQHPAGMPLWSLVHYGKGWISDPKPLDRTRDDGGQFWQNFCRFCLGKEWLDVASGEEVPAGGPAPAPKPRGPLSGAWQASAGAQFRIDDDGKTVTVELIASDVLLRLTGRLARRDQQSLGGILDAVFKADSTKRYAVDVTATIADPGHLRVRCTNWPKWTANGKYISKGTLTDVWARSGDAPVPPPVRPERPLGPPSW